MKDDSPIFIFYANSLSRVNNFVFTSKGENFSNQKSHGHLPTRHQGRFGPSTLDYTDHNNGCGSEIFRAARGCGDVGCGWLMMMFHPGR